MTLAVIAGTGAVAPIVVQAAMAQGRVPVICEMMGTPSQVKGEFTRLVFRLETLGTWLGRLTALGVTEVCMVGAMRRPVIDPSLIDTATAPLVPRLTEAMAQGDDGTLRALVALFEEYGMTVIGAHQIAPVLLPVAGIHTKVAPMDLSNDLAVADVALAEMGRADMGQAMLVRAGHVIAREDDRGTDALLSDFCPPSDAAGKPASGLADVFGVFGDAIESAADWLSASDAQDGATLPGTGAFLYKAPKPGQLLVADMPTIGVTTAKRAARAGLAGIVIAEGGVMVLDLEDVIKVLDAHGMFLWVAP